MKKLEKIEEQLEKLNKERKELLKKKRQKEKAEREKYLAKIGGIFEKSLDIKDVEDAKTVAEFLEKQKVKAEMKKQDFIRNIADEMEEEEGA